jgi:hypothetical protein
LQVFPSRDEFQPPKVKASRCLTKYKWRTAELAGDGPAIVGAHRVRLSIPPLVFNPYKHLRAEKTASLHALTLFGGETHAATQVVSDFVTTFDGPNSTARVLSAQGKPALVYTYKMRFTRLT